MIASCIENLTYLNFVILADRDVTNVVFLTQLLGQGSSHQLPTNVGRGTKVTLAVLASRGSYPCVQLHGSDEGTPVNLREQQQCD